MRRCIGERKLNRQVTMMFVARVKAFPIMMNGARECAITEELSMVDSTKIPTAPHTERMVMNIAQANNIRTTYRSLQST